MGDFTVRRETTIGRRLFKQSILIAIGLTILLTIFQVWLNYQSLLSTINHTIEQIETGQADGISTALWNYSMPELTAQTEGIVHFPNIAYAEVQENGKTITRAGAPKTDRVLFYRIPLMHVDNNGINEVIGTLTIQADLAQFYNSIVRQVLLIFAFQGINVLIILLVMLLLINHQVTRHITAAAKYFNKFEFENLNIPLVLNRKPSNDEIDILVDSYNLMRMNLSRSYQERHQSERKRAALLSNLPGMAFRWKYDREWIMELVSAGSRKLTGFSPDEMIGFPRSKFNKMIFSDDQEKILEIFESLRPENPVFDITFRIRTRDGQVKWVWERGIGIFDENHKLNTIEGFITDVTKSEQREREVEAIAALSVALRTAITREQMMPIIMEQIVKLLNVNGATLELIDSRTGDAVVELAYGTFIKFQNMRIPPEKGLNQIIRSSGKPFLENHLSENIAFDYPEIARDCSAVGGVPLIAQGELFGFLWIGRKIEITETEMHALSALAEIAANSLHRAGLFHQTEQQLKRLIGLRKIDTAINNNLPLVETINLFLDQTVDLLHVDAANIIILKTDKHREYTTSIGLSPENSYPIHSVLQCEWCQKMLAEQKIFEINSNSIPNMDPSFQNWFQSQGFQSGFAIPLITRDEIKGILQVFRRTESHPDADWLEFLNTLAGQAAIAISEAHLLRDLKQSNAELQTAYDATIEGWSNALDLRDKETEGHSQRVTELCLAMAKMLNIPEEELKFMRWGSLLHDIGKMGVPDNILLKPGPLDDKEWEIMRRHPLNAYKLLEGIEFLQPALEIPLSHHEKWDGSGYPHGLKGKEIPLPARIFAVVDVWDALTSERPYRGALSQDEAMQYIIDHSGSHFDPEMVQLFIHINSKENSR